MHTKTNPVVYFEIPVTDMERAVKFYASVFDFQFEKESIDNYEMALFPFQQESTGITGALARGDVYKPTQDGAILYLHTDHIDKTLDKALQLGAKVLYPKTINSGHAFVVAEIEDSEGNRIALRQLLQAALVIKPYETPYDDPITLQAREVVTLGEEEQEEKWKGWIWADNGKKAGWVPIPIIDFHADKQTGEVTESYTAQELNVLPGEKVLTQKSLNGWAWVVKIENGEEGWIPEEVLKISDEHAASIRTRYRALGDIIRRQEAITGGENWLGESFRGKIDLLTEEEAFRKPLHQIHSVAELISHLTVWKEENIKKLNGKPATLTMESPENWRSNEELKAVGWEVLKERFYSVSQHLTGFLQDKNDDFLEESLHPYESNRTILEGLIQHDIYHLGKIGITIKLVTENQ